MGLLLTRSSYGLILLCCPTIDDQLDLGPLKRCVTSGRETCGNPFRLQQTTSGGAFNDEGSGEVADDYEGFALPRPVSAFDERGNRPA